MTDELKRRFEIATKDVTPPAPDPDSVQSRGRRRRRWEVAGSTAVALVLLTAGTLGARAFLDSAPRDVASPDETVNSSESPVIHDFGVERFVPDTVLSGVGSPSIEVGKAKAAILAIDRPQISLDCLAAAQLRLYIEDASPDAAGQLAIYPSHVFNAEDKHDGDRYGYVGTSLDNRPRSMAEELAPGWSHWDVTDIVRRWVGQQPFPSQGARAPKHGPIVLALRDVDGAEPFASATVTSADAPANKPHLLVTQRSQCGERAIAAVKLRHKLAFAVLDDRSSSGNADIYVSRVDGTDVAPFLSSPYAEFYPEWSPDGSQLAFVSDRDEPGNIDIYVATSDGSMVTRVTNNPAIDTAPSWSADGTRLAFARNISGRDEIFVVLADGTGETRLTHNSSVDVPLDWSADGSQIAFARNDDGQVDVWLMNPDGSDQRRLTDDPAAETNLSWAPEGSRLALTRSAQGKDQEIALLSLEDGAIDQVTHDDIDQRHLAWSPDGDELLFTGGTISSNDAGVRESSSLYVLDLATGRVRELSVSDREVRMPSWRR